MALATTFNLPNYVGELFQVGQNKTPFLNMIGGLSGGRTVSTWEYSVALEETLGVPSQPDITETASLTAPTPTTIVPSQKTNVCQIFHKSVAMSYSRQSDNATLSGLPILGTNEITDPYEHQKMLQVRQIALDAEYTFLNGTYQRAAAATTDPAADEKSNKTRGILTAIQTNVVAAGDASLSRALINTLLRSMATNGSPFTQPVLFCNALQKQTISAIYGAAPLGGNVPSRTVGGVNVETLVTDFAEIGVVYDPFMPTDTVLIADLSVVFPVFLAVPNKGFLFYEDLATTGAGVGGQIYGQMGLAYGPETFHGKITGLAD